MENPTKALIFLLVTAFWACKPKVEASGNSSKPFYHQAKPNTELPTVPKVVEMVKTPLGKGLFRDSLGTIYLKVKNRRIQLPSYDPKTWPDSIFQSRVQLWEEDTLSELSEVVDTATFVKVNKDGTYFQDAYRIYVYSMFPLAVQFFSFKKTGARYLDSEKEYLLVRDTLFWHGRIVDGFKPGNVSVVRYKKQKNEGFEEFIFDGQFLYNGDRPLDEEQLSFFFDISKQDKEKIRNRYFKKPVRRETK